MRRCSRPGPRWASVKRPTARSPRRSWPTTSPANDAAGCSRSSSPRSPSARRSDTSSVGWSITTSGGARRSSSPVCPAWCSHRQRGEHQAGHTGDEERLAPPEVVIDQPTDDVSERRADGDRGEEDREHPAASFAGEVVGQERRGDRVHDDEASHERPELRIRELELRVLHALGKRRDDPPVQIVEQVDQREDGERPPPEPRELGPYRWAFSHDVKSPYGFSRVLPPAIEWVLFG